MYMLYLMVDSYYATRLTSPEVLAVMKAWRPLPLSKLAIVKISWYYNTQYKTHLVRCVDSTSN